MCVSASQPASPIAPADTGDTTSVSDTFAIDAGRDLFFPGMDEGMAISILGEPLGSLCEHEDRYIAAERLKFFPSEASARALMKFISAFPDPIPTDLQVIEVAARRKAVESLGRFAGAYLATEVADFLEKLLEDSDALTAEGAAWAISQLTAPTASALGALEKALLAPNASHRTLLRALTAARATGAVPAIRALLDKEPCVLDETVMSAAATALAVLAGDTAVISEVPTLLRSPTLNVRRAAVSDLGNAKYRPALGEIARTPLSIVLRAQSAREVLRGELDSEAVHVLDRLFWDHPCDLDLLGRVRTGKRQRNVERNVRALYRNDALDSYVACKTLCEDADVDGEAAKLVLASHTEREYFDYFGAYHAFKTLGWMRYEGAFDALAEAARTLPPRFFNHRAAAILSLGNLGDSNAVDIIRDIAVEKNALWHIRYACLIAAERLGDDSVKKQLREDDDWLVRARASSEVDFEHLRVAF